MFVHLLTSLGPPGKRCPRNLLSAVLNTLYRNWPQGCNLQYYLVSMLDFMLPFRIIQSFRLEKTFKIIESNHQPCPLDHVLKCLVYALFEYLQGWWLNHFPGQPVPMPGNPFSKEIFPNIQSKPPLPPLEAISSHPVTSYLIEDRSGDGTKPVRVQGASRQCA